jgi:hypothetical protein
MFQTIVIFIPRFDFPSLGFIWLRVSDFGAPVKTGKVL